VFVIESSDAVNAGMAKHADGRPLTLLRKSPPSVSSAVGYFVGWLAPSTPQESLPYSK
jgi:hypothetical protein